MLQLPDEILTEILKNIYCVDEIFQEQGNKTDMLSCRETCTHLASLGQEFVFQHLTFIQDEAGLGSQKMMDLSTSPYLCHNTRCITFSFRDFDQETWSTGSESSLPAIWKDWTLPEAYAWAENSGNKDTVNTDVISLAMGLPLFKNLKSIKILQPFNHGWSDWICLTSNEVELFSDNLNGHRFFNALTTALSISGLSIEDLTIGSLADACAPSILGVIRSLTPGRVKLYQAAFRGLKSLRIVLPWTMLSEDGTDYDYNFHGIAALIRSGPLLETLQLQFDMQLHSGTMLPCVFLESLSLSKLHTLILHFALVDNHLSLIKLLLRHSTTLKHVEFGNLALETGQWEPVFASMRDCLDLESFVMKGRFTQNGYDEIGPNWTVHGRQVLRENAIEEYVLGRTTENPFDMLRSACSKVPQHSSQKDIMLCACNACPYLLYPSRGLTPTE